MNRIIACIFITFMLAACSPGRTPTDIGAIFDTKCDNERLVGKFQDFASKWKLRLTTTQHVSKEYRWEAKDNSGIYLVIYEIDGKCEGLASSFVFEAEGQNEWLRRNDELAQILESESLVFKDVRLQLDPYMYGGCNLNGFVNVSKDTCILHFGSAWLGRQQVIDILQERALQFGKLKSRLD